ncbi:c-type cytochrome domain-containing protein [Pirellulaceae bacterium SH449]
MFRSSFSLLATFGSSSSLLMLAIKSLVGLWAINSVCSATDFYSDVFPILKANCIACHNAQKSDGGLNLESFEAIQNGGDSGAAYSTESVDESNIIRRVTGEDELMPPEGNNVGAKRLTESEIAIIQKWIVEGAIAGAKMSSAILNWQPVPESVKPIYTIDTSFAGQTTVMGRGNLAVVQEWAAVGVDEQLLLSDGSVANRFQRPATHLDIVQSVAITRDGDRIATGGFRDVKIWKRVAGELESSLSKKLRGSVVICTSPDGSRVARTTDTPSIEVFDTASAQLLARWDSNDPIDAMDWNSASDSLVVSSATGDLYFLDGIASKENLNRNLSEEARHPTGMKFATLQLGASDYLLGLTSDSVLAAWRISRTEDGNRSLEVLTNLPSMDMVNSFAVMSDSMVAVSREGQPTISIVNLNDGMVVRTIDATPQVQLLAMPSGISLIGLGMDGVTRCWNSQDGSLIWENREARSRQMTVVGAETLVARQKAKVDRGTNAIPEWEKNKSDEEANLAKVTKSRDDADEAVKKKSAELTEIQNQLAVSEQAVEAANQAVEEAKAKLEAAQKEAAAKREQVAAVEKARAELEQRLMAWNGTVQSATETVSKVTNAFAAFQARLEELKQELVTLEASKASVNDDSIATTGLAGCLTPDARRIVCFMDSGELRIIRTDNGKSERSLSSGFDERGTVAADSNGRVYQICRDGRSRSWELGMRWELERTIGSPEDSPFSDRVTAMVFTEDGSQLIVGSGPPSRFGEMKIISVADGSIVKDFGEVHSDTILCLKVSPDGLIVASSGADKLVKLHSLREDLETKTLEGHTHHVLGLAWHDDGFLLASSSADNTVKIWDIESGQSTRTISGFGKEVTALAFAGRTSQLVSASTDHQVRVHDINNGAHLKSLAGANDALYSLAVITGSHENNDSIALSGGQQGVVWVWKISDGSLIKQLQ